MRDNKDSLGEFNSEDDLDPAVTRKPLVDEDAEVEVETPIEGVEEVEEKDEEEDDVPGIFGDRDIV